jgi:hypothetical protein
MQKYNSYSDLLKVGANVMIRHLPTQWPSAITLLPLLLCLLHSLTNPTFPTLGVLSPVLEVARPVKLAAVYCGPRPGLITTNTMRTDGVRQANLHDALQKQPHVIHYVPVPNRTPFCAALPYTRKIGINREPSTEPL